MEGQEVVLEVQRYVPTNYAPQFAFPKDEVPAFFSVFSLFSPPSFATLATC